MAEATEPKEKRKKKDNGEALNIQDLKEMNIQSLNKIARELEIEGAASMRKKELIFQILKAQTARSGLIFSEGMLETLPDGFVFLSANDNTYLLGPDYIYAHAFHIRHAELCT